MRFYFSGEVLISGCGRQDITQNRNSADKLMVYSLVSNYVNGKGYTVILT
jgi:hypothetical protein